ncbi:hypothetical protein CLOSYM_00807 [[Clostridium] symbiosum ATCC 14940]|uniref:Uncharacterized protein n=1 Tax=[Clostridium] symbiosum ATCC 14940 TaxID=411472 RepID=A0ABC9U2C7_CLOSY|nr:hypothetical protein CLOSYM_00807 [[Clostridium] symbiosum ATCC 14940]
MLYLMARAGHSGRTAPGSLNSLYPDCRIQFNRNKIAFGIIGW